MTDAPLPSLDVLTTRTFAAVLFDMDGTLVDSTPAVTRSWVRLAQEEGVDPDRLVGHHGIPAQTIVERLFPEHRWEEASARILELELTDTDGVVALPGAEAALAALAPYRLSAIATSCTRELFEVRYAVCGLPRPAVVVTVSDVASGKPDPDPYLAAAAALGVDPAECLVVEDAPGGLQSARAAGCTTLALTTTTPRQAVDDGGLADGVADDLSQVVFGVEDGRVRVSARGSAS